MTNTILQITRVEQALIDDIKPSFDKLPTTDHADGNYRLRKYSRVLCDAEGQMTITRLGATEFTQSSKYNKHQGDSKRVFEPIEESVIQSEAIKQMIGVVRRAVGLGIRFDFDIHQMRVICTGGATQLSPEGWHQDGYDCVAMIGIDRCNIIGGDVLLSTSKVDKPFLEAPIDSGTMVIVDDSVLWHNGRSIQPINDDCPAFMDILVFTIRT